MFILISSDVKLAVLKNKKVTYVTVWREPTNCKVSGKNCELKAQPHIYIFINHFYNYKNESALLNTALIAYDCMVNFDLQNNTPVSDETTVITRLYE